LRFENYFDAVIKVIIVEDEFLARELLRDKINDFDDIVVVGDYEGGEALIEALPALDFDVALLDIALKGMPMQGVEVARYLRRERPSVKILAVSSEISKETISKMLDAGIDGFLSKYKISPENFAEAIREVASGLEYFTRDVSAVMRGIIKSKDVTDKFMSQFTEQETRIIELSKEKLPAKLIADRLNISTATVYKHNQNIYKKLGINKSAELAQYALEKGVI